MTGWFAIFWSGCFLFMFGFTIGCELATALPAPPKTLGWFRFATMVFAAGAVGFAVLWLWGV